VLTYTEVVDVEGEAGNFKVTLLRKPRYIIEERCRGCSVCVESCPVSAPDPFNLQLANSKAIHIYFSQAIPLITYIDEEHCLYFREGKCRICEHVCENDAIDFAQIPRKVTLNVGAIIVAVGFAPHLPQRGIYGYRRYANVVTSLEYERLLSSTGPSGGEIRRLSDGARPHRIAWLSCVGSRRTTQGDNSYCSAVCCSYNLKQIILTKLHSPDAECTVFHNDIRTYAKDCERFFERTKALSGVHFIRSYAAVVGENPQSKSVIVRYRGGDSVVEEEFDLVVLSVGLEAAKNAEQIARVLGIDLTEQRFCVVDERCPLQTSRAGVFVCGAFAGPRDIPESVFGASGAAALAGCALQHRRARLAKPRKYPPQEDHSGEEPRIGVFVCHCGANIGRVVDVPSCVEFAKSLPGVVHAQEQLFSCATNSVQEIAEVIKEKRLNRVVVAACSPLTHEPLFRDTLQEAGLNPYYLEMANIREHNSWVHTREPERATEKAKDLIRMAVARAYLLEPLQEIELPLRKDVLVVGGGIAGMVCALTLADQKIPVHIVEKEPQLGGVACSFRRTLDGLDVQKFVNDLIARVYRHPLIRVHTSATIEDSTGYVGNFKTKVKTPRGELEIEHGAVVLATGARESKPEEYLYGANECVMTQLEFERQLADGDERIKNAKSVVMIQCVGSRNEKRPYCSRVCCTTAIKNALEMKRVNPDADIYILFRDIRTYGLYEEYYRAACDAGIYFIRYDADNPPAVEARQERLVVTVADAVLKRRLELEADVLVLSAAVEQHPDAADLAQIFKVAQDSDGFFREAHLKLRPVELGTDGVFVCGMAHYPKHIPEVVAQAVGAAGRVLALLAQERIKVSGAVCVVEERRCIGCGACVAVCAYNAISLRKTKKGKKATVNPILCKGDGLCNTVCPTGAITLKHFTDEQMNAQIETAFADFERALSGLGAER